MSCHSQLKRAKNRRLKVLYCNADTFTQEKKHELQVLMAEDQPDIVAITEVNPKGRSYKMEDIKIREYITFESNLRCVGRRGVAVLVHSSLEHSVSALEANTEFQESLWLNFKLQNLVQFSVMYTVVPYHLKRMMVLLTWLWERCVVQLLVDSPISV